MNIEVGKYYTLRSGAKAKIIAVNETIDFSESVHSIIGIVEHQFGSSIRRSVATWDKDGAYHVKVPTYQSGLDIIEEFEEPKETVLYINLYPFGVGWMYNSRSEADSAMYSVARLACKRVVIKEGEFDV